MEQNLLINKIFSEHIEVAKNTQIELSDSIILSCNIILKALLDGKKIIFFGNGGSAADAQHFAAEFTGRFVKERRALAAIALTTDTSAITAIGNDFGFDQIFERQIEALGRPGDIVIGISTSGNSLNVINAIKKSNSIGCISITLTGNDGGKLKSMSEINLNIPDSVTARIQEMHLIIGHIFCDFIDSHI